MAPWHLRPRSAPEVVDASVQLLRQHARPLFLLSVILTIPGLLLGLVNSLVLGDAIYAQGPGGLPTVRPGGFLVLLPTILLSLAWLAVAFGALVASASSAYVDGAALEPGDALRRAGARWGVLLGSGMLTYLLLLVQLLGLMVVGAIVIGVVSFVVAAAGGTLGGSAAGTAAGGALAVGIGFAAIAAFFAAAAWLAGRYVTLPAVAANEHLGVRDTMRRARALSRGSLGRITALLLLVGVIAFVAAIGGLLAFGLVFQNTAVASALTSVVYVPLYAFLAALVAVLYYDLRVRHEGLDIELLAAEIAPAPHLAADPTS